MSEEVCPAHRFMEAKIDEVKAQSQKLEEAINGNGKPGIKQDVAMLTQYVKTLTRLTWTVFGLVAAEVVRAVHTYFVSM